jgi:hypothetical protein
MDKEATSNVDIRYRRNKWKGQAGWNSWTIEVDQFTSVWQTGQATFLRATRPVSSGARLRKTKRRIQQMLFVERFYIAPG